MTAFVLALSIHTDYPAADDPPAKAQEAEAVAAIEKLGGKIERFSKKEPKGEVYYVRFSEREKCQITDDDLKHVAALPHLTWLVVVGQKKVTGEGLKHVSKLTKLQHIDLARSSVNGEHLKHLSEMNQLVRLGLWDTEIDDAGLVHLKELKNLEFLFLVNLKIGDEGIRNLGDKPKVMDLRLGGTNVTDACIPLVKKQFPDASGFTAMETKITPAGGAAAAKLGLTLDFTSKY